MTIPLATEQEATLDNQQEGTVFKHPTMTPTMGLGEAVRPTKVGGVSVSSLKSNPKIAAADCLGSLRPKEATSFTVRGSTRSWWNGHVHPKLSQRPLSAVQGAEGSAGRRIRLPWLRQPGRRLSGCVAAPEKPT